MRSTTALRVMFHSVPDHAPYASYEPVKSVIRLATGKELPRSAVIRLSIRRSLNAVANDLGSEVDRGVVVVEVGLQFLPDRLGVDYASMVGVLGEHQAGQRVLVAEIDRNRVDTNECQQFGHLDWQPREVRWNGPVEI